MLNTDLKEKNLDKFLKIKVRRAEAGERELVAETILDQHYGYPVLVKPGIDGVMLTDWLGENLVAVNEKLARTGALLFRGFNTLSTESFWQFVRTLSPHQMDYVNRTSPRSLVSNKIYTSTEHPADQVIHMHNELSYSRNWPRRILFYCAEPSETGGETPIADSRKVLTALPEAVRSRFVSKGIMYVRNITPTIGLSWQQVYQTDDKQDVEAYCRKNNIDFEWVTDQHLRLTWVTAAVQEHPVSGEQTWFNHGYFYNSSNMDPVAYEVLSKEGCLPFETFYGDGSTIEPGAIDAVREAFEAAKVSFKWVKGDILLLDNLLMAHGRNAYTGNRKILVAMIDPFQQE